MEGGLSRLFGGNLTKLAVEIALRRLIQRLTSDCTWFPLKNQMVLFGLGFCPNQHEKCMEVEC